MNIRKGFHRKAISRETFELNSSSPLFRNGFKDFRRPNRDAWDSKNNNLRANIAKGAPQIAQTSLEFPNDWG